MWSLKHDLNLATRTGAEVFRRLHDVADAGRFRGYPERTTRETFELFDGFVDASEVTWLSAAEIDRDRSWMPTDLGHGEIHRTLKAVFETIEVVAKHWGSDRVRIVFAFV
ncbi:MAG: hypothetical protein H6819_04045 [Phycisphaerales bacterium]|nr:hypothetical protein [Phycisphaerales bacterium]MCB9856371.1 hypothetical protein [Phycisphaerales bacterium]MCB9864043.1 hypothetical protein [Phycisphaerales bacterium]